MTVLQRLPVWLGDALPHEDKDGMTMNEEHSQAKNRAALVSLLAACLLTAIKLVVGIYTNSLGILSEALHSGLDLLAAAMTLYAVRLSSRPADARHPYGHGKVENLSALGETVLLSLSASGSSMKAQAVCSRAIRRWPLPSGASS